MFEALQLKNFRCFRDLSLESLKRVNLVTGKNDVGKTALLEAVFLHLGAHNPALSINLNAFRGFDAPLGESLETWGWLFRNRETDEPIRLTSVDDGRITRSLTIRLKVPEKTEVPLRKQASGTEAQQTHGLETRPERGELALEFDDGAGQVLTSTAIIREDHLGLTGPVVAPFPTSYFLSTRIRSKQEDIDRFSKLDEVGRQDELLSILHVVEPRLRRLAVHTVRGVTSIRCDVGIGRMVPLAFMGEGLARLLSISVAILSCKDGVVLIDEIENGLHHEALQRTWSGIADAARHAPAQIFATTHSRECIAAAHHAFSESLDYDLQVIRLEQQKEGIRAIPYTKDTLDTSLEMSLEIR
jgi:hypothetical protein